MYTNFSSNKSYASITRDIHVYIPPHNNMEYYMPDDMMYMMLNIRNFNRNMPYYSEYRIFPGKCISHPQHEILKSVISYTNRNTIPFLMCACKLKDPCNKNMENLFSNQDSIYIAQHYCEEIIGCASIDIYRPIKFCNIIEEYQIIKFVPINFHDQNYFHPGIRVIFSYGKIIQEKNLFLNLENGETQKDYTIPFRGNTYVITIKKTEEQLICASYVEYIRKITTCVPTPPLQKPTVHKVNNNTLEVRFKECTSKNCNYVLQSGMKKTTPITLQVISPYVTTNRVFYKTIYCANNKEFTYNNISDFYNKSKKCDNKILPTVKYQENNNGPIICVHNINFEPKEYIINISGVISISNTNTRNKAAPINAISSHYNFGTIMHKMLVPFYKDRQNTLTECYANDRGSLSFYDIPQKVLDKVEQIGNMYKIPTKYVRNFSKVHKKTNNPCKTNKHLLFSYQNTRIIYDTQGKTHVSSYIDNKGNIYIPQDIDNIEPLNPYDQGLCIDNFTTYQFNTNTPTTISNNQTNKIFEEHIKTINNTSTTLPNDFDHRMILNDSCNFLRIESLGSTAKKTKSPLLILIIEKTSLQYPIIIQIKLGRKSNIPSETITKIVISPLTNTKNKYHTVPYDIKQNSKTHIFVPHSTNYFRILSTISRITEPLTNNGMVKITCEQW
ncbi:hypothetical protein LUA82_01360 [Neoehrlichia mikurensis]|nr:hypothetical protein [Neoehrlichia mikurensis]UTO55714.1 hypothetical protein LUA82_01360 [Neoehrlichia mikurensis]